MADHKTLTAALVAVQSELKPAVKNSTAAYGKYADLSSCLTAIHPVVTKHGIAVVQMPTMAEEGVVSVTTQLRHASGEILESTLHMPLEKRTPQGVGTAITYARRYALCSLVGLALEDTDAQDHEAVTPVAQPAPRPRAKVPSPGDGAPLGSPVAEPEPAPDDGQVRIMAVEQFEGTAKTSGKPWVKWRIRTSTGEHLATFDAKVAAAAEAAQGSQIPVELATETSSNEKWDDTLLAVSPVLEGELTEDLSPF